MNKYFNEVKDYFVDLLLCINEFQINPVNSEIASKSIELIRICSKALVSGDIIPLSDIEKGILFTDDAKYIKLWWPILFGLSKSISDKREPIRLK
jgi:hypothetical protein